MTGRVTAFPAAGTLPLILVAVLLGSCLEARPPATAPAGQQGAPVTLPTARSDDADPPPLVPGRPPAPTAADLERIAASYRAEVRESDRLRFSPFDAGLPRSGQWRDGFAVADMNGDGHLDIVHGPPRKSAGQPVIFLGDGRGSWRRWIEARFPGLPYDYGDAQVGPISGDRRLIVLAMHLRGLVALEGDGRGQFTDVGSGLDLARGGPAGTVAGFFSRAVRLVDWNGDGRVDILALGEGPQPGGRGPIRPASRGVALYLRQADGSWVRRAPPPSASPIFGPSIAVGDFNGDGRPDFATGTGIQGRKDLVNLGLADGGWRTLTLDALRPMAYVGAVIAADLDRDGRDDLVVGYLAYEGGQWWTGIDVFYPRADGRWTRRALAAEAGRRAVASLAVGQLDGDGRPDLVALTGNGEIWTFLGDGAGFFTRERRPLPAFGGGCQGSHVELADLDKDGRDEIIASFGDEAASDSPSGHCPAEGGLAVWKATSAP